MRGTSGLKHQDQHRWTFTRLGAEGTSVVTKTSPPGGLEEAAGAEGAPAAAPAAAHQAVPACPLTGWDRSMLQSIAYSS